MKNLIARNKGLIVILMASWGIMFLLRGCFSGEGICFGLCERHEISRAYHPEKDVFMITTPYDMGREKPIVTHHYGLGKKQTLSGTSFIYSQYTAANDHGQDAKLFYLPPEKEQFYQVNYGQTGQTCPASFLQHNLNVYILVGVDETVTKQLRGDRYKLDNNEVPYSYEGHILHYSHSELPEGTQTTLSPAMFESSYSNVGHSNIPYTYFLVTRIK